MNFNKVPASLASRSRPGRFTLNIVAAAAAHMLLMGAVQAQSQAVDASQEAQQSLPALKVTAKRGPTTTEGSGSYTTTAPVSTATKLGLSLRETPQSISVITRERMDEMGLQNLTDVINATPGVFAQALDERVSYFSRGYTITNFQVDGMLNTFGGSMKANGDNVVYDRIEIIRGATGLTTGAGDPSATINQIRKMPTMTFQGHAAVRVGSFNLRRAEADISGPIAFDGKVRGRLVVAKQKSDSFRDFYKEDRTVAYGVLEADLGPDTTVSVGHEYQAPKTSGVSWGTVVYWNADGSVANLPRSTNYSASWSSWPLVENKTFATLKHDFGGGWGLRAAYTHSQRDTNGKVWFGGNGNPRPDGTGITAWTSHFVYDESMDVLDLNLDGKFGLFGRKHEVVAGWGKSIREGYSPRIVTPAMPASYTNVPDWRNWTGDVAEFPTTVQPFPSSIARLDQSAAFVATRLNWTDRVKTVLGARYSNWKTNTRNFNATTGAPTTTTGYEVNDVFTPYAGLLVDVSKEFTVYTSYTDIFQPQNYRDKNGTYLDPVVGKSYEVGLKGEHFDKRLNTSIAFFKSQKDNVAEVDDSVPSTVNAGSGAYKSTGKGNKVDGVELEASGQVTPRWNLGGGYSYTRSRDAKGQPINTIMPRNLFKVFTSYRLDGTLQGLTVGGGLNYQSTIWVNAQRPNGTLNPDGSPAGFVTARMEQKSYVLASLMASYKVRDDITVGLNVNNLFDKHYYNRVGFYNGVYWGEPRTVSLSAKYSF
ncbi:MAG TPA: TonB-dependent siderophore receptor [Candidatus Aquabacterium excrementipullorum]|nr:TonB-dependent siderophore receptor [Candidatus Aquabacterium excrementipullorum]